MISTALRDRVRQAAVEARLSAYVCRCIDHDLVTGDWRVLAATLDAAAQFRHDDPLAELAAEVRAEVRS